ncbi:TraB/GumN family protein [Halopenitus sp. POP-27]|uniref:TraB/GumN family protein n=1 Tax=Halopenitus sp. POP-27 TaxID=2994425 RepID=UPI0024695187|nr:TraB/GumN family protein [Halopenitus sp. POP-27]
MPDTPEEPDDRSGGSSGTPPPSSTSSVREPDVGDDADADHPHASTSNADGDGDIVGDSGSMAGSGSVTVVGTAHVSNESVTEVEETIERERPDVVAVELDEGRYRQLQGETPDDLDASDLLKGNTVFQFLAYWMLSYVQTQLGERFDIEPGADMMAAVETAQSLGIDVALVDRDIQTTMQRFWARMTITEKLRMVGGLAFGVTDSRIVGLLVGLIVGLLVGPAIGLFGGAIGVTDAMLLRTAGGVIVGGIAAYLATTIGSGSFDPETRMIAALATGLSVAGIAALTGVLDGVLTAWLSPFAIRALGSLGLGLFGGLTLGLFVAGVLSLFGGLEPTEEGGIEELELSELTDADAVTMMMEEFRQFSPGGAEALIDERDAYIAHRLVVLRDRGFDVVAVVGAGHRQGIESYLANPATLPPAETLVGTEHTSARRIPWGTILGYGITIAFVAFFVLLAMAGVSNGFLLRVFAAWFAINAVFAFAFAKLAGARWTSAGVGGAVAWMTSINPMLAPGWFVGWVELRTLSVNVSDIATLNELLSDETKPVSQILSEMFDVPLFRLIMVVAMTNIGSIVASFLFATYLVPLFSAELGGVADVSQLMVDGARRSARTIWEVFVTR